VAFRVLLVEGEPTRGVRDVLARAGCAELWTAASCFEAVERAWLERLAPDLVVVDLPALEPTALLVLRRLRGVPALAIVEETATEAALSAGALDVVTRPIRTAELHARIGAALQRRTRTVRRALRTKTLTGQIRKLREEKLELERLVCVDSLTGIANRRHALSLLEAEWKRGSREALPLALVMIDLDEFHAYNARYGHPGGDACLRRAAAAMVACLRRPSDLLGRYGGEEFVAILANTGACGARVVAERLRDAVEALGIPHENSPCAPVVTVSAGFAAMLPTAEQSAAPLIEAADLALRRAKELGRNRVIGDAPPVAPVRPSGDPWWERCSPVTVDPSLADRIPPFLDGVRDAALAIDDARRAQDSARIRALARKLKADARHLGFDEIQRLAVQLERAGRAPDRETLQLTAAELHQYAAHVQVVYRRRTMELPVAVPVL
jgi:two-component system, chemotaxis family, response regulator WspR